MVESYWGLTRRPFGRTCRPGAYYPSDVHQAALLKLRYGVDVAGGLAILAGEAGLGKSLLLELLHSQVSESISPWIQLPYPQLTAGELLAYLAAEWTGDDELHQVSLDRVIRRLQIECRQHVEQNRRAALVVDDAQLLAAPELFEALRLLLNLGGGDCPLVIVLAGQLGLVSLLERLPHVEQHAGVKCVLRPFTREETAGFVQHALLQAGARQEIFDSSALDELHRQSLGVPRQIQRLADLALLWGYGEERKQLDRESIAAVAEDVALAPR